MKPSIVIVGPSLKVGGIERASVNLANELSALGHDVTYFAIFKHQKVFELNTEVIFEEPTDGTNVHELNLFRTIRRLRKRMGEINPTAIIVFNKFYAAITCLALVGTPYRPFISERSSPLFVWSLKLRIFNRLAFFLHPPKGVIAQTEIAAQYQRKYYRRDIPVHVIPNAVRHVSLFPDITRQPFILAVGRLDDYLKGFERLIDVLADVDPSWSLVFVGGSANKNLEKKVNAFGLAHRVKFLGQVADVDSILATAGIFVIPSLSEGFPNALCEAMSAGVPCISFDFVAGPREIINHGVNGIIVENGNLKAMASAINDLIRNPDRRRELGKEAMTLRNRLNGAEIARLTAKFVLENK